MSFSEIIAVVNDFVWGPYMLVLLVGTGVFLTIRLKFLPWRNLGYALRSVFTRAPKDENAKEHSGDTVSYTHLDVYKRQVMEGKAVLFKSFGNVDAFPICVSTQDADEIIQTGINIAPTFGGINLEDISAPKCFEIEEKLQEALDIPVFHDDQHGTAIVVSSGPVSYTHLDVYKRQLMHQ